MSSSRVSSNVLTCQTGVCVTFWMCNSADACGTLFVGSDKHVRVQTETCMSLLCQLVRYFRGFDGPRVGNVRHEMSHMSAILM